MTLTKQFFWAVFVRLNLTTGTSSKGLKKCFILSFIAGLLQVVGIY